MRHVGNFLAVLLALLSCVAIAAVVLLAFSLAG
jgi:hypothetical protein